MPTPLEVMKLALGLGTGADLDGDDDVDADDDAILEPYLTLAAQLLSFACFQRAGVYNQAVGYLAAHMYTATVLRGPDGPVGPVTGERSGQRGVNYGFIAQTMRDDGLDATNPGRLFLLVQRRVACGVFATTNPAFNQLVAQHG